jgi:hemolysin III
MADALDHQPSVRKPSWRGWIHLGTLPLALAAGIVLIVLAQGVAASVSSAIFVTTSVLMFGVSGTYHRFNWSPKNKVLLKRLDHANIFLLIAGTYTPIAVLALPNEKALRLLMVIWVGTLLGIGFRVLWIGAPRWLYVMLYLGLGWGAVMYMGDLFRANVAMMVLVIAGGLAYSLGAIVYATKRPNPAPATFGFHEIFHALTVVAFMCHWSAVLLIALNPPLVG